MNTQSLDAWEPEVAARGVPEESPKKDLFDMSKLCARGWGDTSWGQRGCAWGTAGGTIPSAPGCRHSIMTGVAVVQQSPS